MARLELFFDCGSPWTYLAFHAIEALAAESDIDLERRPILVGGVFNAVNPSVYEQRANATPAKWKYHAKDLQDWARLYGLSIQWPEVFPVNSVNAMRGCLAADEQGKLGDYARALFEAYWGEGLDISQPGVLAEVAKRAGLEPEAMAARIAAADVKERLRANTDELIERGGFGSPTIFVNGDDMYFGNDRLPLVRMALIGAAT
jgi:2-hydroxychromene-2-carboxylate isomerase